MLFYVSISCLFIFTRSRTCRYAKRVSLESKLALSLRRLPSLFLSPHPFTSTTKSFRGKSTLFNALVRASLAAASNYPFCTIESQAAAVPVPDARLQRLAILANSARAVPWALEVRDIAGLIAGASKGEGLGNAFLADIRGVHAILQVVRCFESPDVIHVCDAPDPARDIAIIENELILADAQSIEKRLPAARKAAMSGKIPEAAAMLRLLELVQPALEAGFPARAVLSSQHSLDARDTIAWERLQLLTTKPMMYVLNVGENDAAPGSENALTRVAREAIAGRAAEQAAASGGAGIKNNGTSAYSIVSVCAQVEAELALLPDGVERAELLSAYGLPRSGMDQLLEETAKLLRLHAYYTIGPTESRAWVIPDGATSAEAAGVIHSDMQKGYIKADVIGFAELEKIGSEAKAKELGLVRQEGKDYIVQSGDVMVFKFKAP